MKLVRVRIRNFRCYRDELSIDIGNITALIGKNDAGKSAIMDALDIFFENSKLDPDDAHIEGDKKDVRIICEFSDLPIELVLDATNRTTLGSEYLLNEDGNLEIHKVYNGSLKKPRLKATFVRAQHPSAEGMGDLLALKNAELKMRAEKLGVDISGIDNRVNAQLRRAIWESAGNLQLASKEIPLDAEDARKIWDQLKKELPAFALFKSDRPSTDQDSEAQDPMKAAVEEALKSKEAELRAITGHVQQEVESIAQQTVEKIREMDPTLASELKPRFQPPNWKSVFKISLTDEDQVPVNKRGSGIRRLILLNFFRAKAEQKASRENAQGVIYAIEEPETSQHPNNQKMLMDALADLAEDPGRQVIVSTHVPMLARTLPTDALRYIEVGDDGSRVIYAGDEETTALVARALGVLADHDVKLFVGVEGRNDINFLRGISRILHVADNTLPDLYALEDKGHVIFFPMGGANLALWASRTRHLNIPELYIQDSDCRGPEQPSPHQAEVDETNNKTNCTAILTRKREMESYLHPDAIKAARPEVDIQFGDFDDVPLLTAKAIHEASESDARWDDLPDDKIAKKVSQAKKWLNTEAVEEMTPELLAERDPEGDVKSWLTKITELMNEQPGDV